ncbi:hypothetical protein DVH24_025680 [Malus domestica]|uniref:J domain-containing protein n=1 Tax=Malus domestica TaxID=3750 RepID=A0A498KJG7_MALDO|nr:hypothetical protein DVH24_025680 [Malus domestica]
MFGALKLCGTAAPAGQKWAKFWFRAPPWNGFFYPVEHKIRSLSHYLSLSVSSFFLLTSIRHFRVLNFQIKAFSAQAFTEAKPRHGASAVSLYEVLRVTADASPTEIKSAYWSLAKQYHPDVSQSKSDGRISFRFTTPMPRCPIWQPGISPRFITPRCLIRQPGISPRFTTPRYPDSHIVGFRTDRFRTESHRRVSQSFTFRPTHTKRRTEQPTCFILHVPNIHGTFVPSCPVPSRSVPSAYQTLP